MALQKGTLNGVPIVEDSASTGTPVTDVTGDGGDVIAGVAAHVARARSSIVVDTVADLASVTPLIDGQTYQTLRYSSSHTVGDGSGNLYRYVASDTTTADGGFVITHASGRFHAVDKSVANVMQFGAIGDGVTDAATAFDNCLASGAPKAVIAGNFLVSSGSSIALSADIVVDATQAVITGDGTRDFLIIGDGNNLHWVGGKFDTWLDVFTFGPVATGDQAVTIERVVAESIYALTADPGHANFAYCRDFAVRNCYIDGCTFGVQYRPATWRTCEVTGNTIINVSSSTQAAGIDIGTNNRTYSDEVDGDTGLVKVADNWIKSVVSSGTDIDTHGIRVYGRGATIENNTVIDVSNADGGQAEGIYTKCHYGKIIGNTVIDGGQGEGCIACKGEVSTATAPDVYGHSITVANNLVLETTAATALLFLRSDRCVAYGNQLIGPGTGIDTGGEDVRIFGNTLIGSSSASGIVARANSVITDNKISDYQNGIGLSANTAGCTTVKSNNFKECVNGLLLNTSTAGNRAIIEGNYQSGGTRFFNVAGTTTNWSVVVSKNNIATDLSNAMFNNDAGFGLHVKVDNYDEGVLSASTETVTAASPTLATHISTQIDSSSNAVNATLPDGDYVGQTKTIVMTDATNESTVTVTNHKNGSDVEYIYNTINQTVALMWNGAHWLELAQ